MKIFRPVAFLFGLLSIPVSFCDELWEKDMSNEVYISTNTDSFERVDLECRETEMEVKIKLKEKDFDGIFYTRGAYKEKRKPCFSDPKKETDKLKLRIPFDDCKTAYESGDDGGSLYKNVVIVQQDDFLIFPGDSAFEIGCRKTADGLLMANIGLADPDPGAKPLPKHRRSTVEAETKVTFTPDDVRPKKKNKETSKKSSKKSKKKKKKAKVSNFVDKDEL